jgi:hypothetical protein
VFQRVKQHLQYAIEIFEHFIVPEPEDVIAISGDFRRTSGVSRWLCGVLTTIQLDDQLACRTGKVGDEPANGMLSPEFPGRSSCSQSVPEDAFRIGGVAPEISCDNSARASGHAGLPTSPRPSPPPGAEREPRSHPAWP